MKNKLFNVRLWQVGLALLVITILGAPSTQAQTSITKFHPLAGFIGDTIVITGTELDKVVSVDLNNPDYDDLDPESVEKVTAAFKKVSATSIEFSIPEGAGDGWTLSVNDGSSDIVSKTLNGDSEIVDANSRIFIPEEVNEFEQLVFFESMVDPWTGGSPNGGSLADHESNDRFVNDGLTFSGDASLSWGTKGTDRNYAGASAEFGIAVSNGEYFQIDGINTEELENVRLSFAIGSWYTFIKGGLEISHSIDGGTTWTSMGGVSDYGVGDWVFRRIGKVLPSAASVSIKFEFNQPESGNDLVFDDIKVTGFPAGIATVAEFIPSKGLPGKELIIKGASLGDVKTVRFLGEDDSNIDVTDISVAGDGASITLTLPQKVKTSIVTLINSKGEEFTSIDELQIEDVTPRVKEFAPAAAPIGGLVVFNGEYLYNVEGVSFNNVEATEFYYVDDETLEVYVPAGAATGTVVVTTTQGSYDSSDEILWDPDNDANTDNSIDIKLGDFEVDSSVPLLTISLSATEAKEGESVELIAKLSAAADQDVKLAISATGDLISEDDYTLANDTITIKGGSVESDIVLLSLLDDGDDFEEAEEIDITLVGAIGEAVLGKPRVQTIKIGQPEVLSVGDALEGQEVLVYKNNSGLNIQLHKNLKMGNASAVIYDLNGTRMYLKQFDQINEKVIVPEVNQFRAGVYVLMLADYQGQYVRKFVIK